MSTNSLIGFLQDSGKVKYIYCHWDGYLENNGQILADHYTDINKVKQLIELGSLSQLGPNIGEKHTFAEHDKFHELEVHPGWCLSYFRDRQEDWANVKPKICTEQEFWANNDWVYLFDGNWKFRPPIREVKYALEDAERNKVPQTVDEIVSYLNKLPGVKLEELKANSFFMRLSQEIYEKT